MTFKDCFFFIASHKQIICQNAVCNSDLVEAEKVVAVFQVHLDRVEVEHSLAERCSVGLLQGVHQWSLVPAFHFVFHGDTGTRREQPFSR